MEFFWLFGIKDLSLSNKTLIDMKPFEGITNEEQEQLKMLLELREPEDLHPDLERYKVKSHGWICIKHPLVFDIMYIPENNKRLNKTYEVKRNAVREYFANKNWAAYVFMHERPYRLDALQEIIDRIETDEDKWELIREIWIDSENIAQNKKVWRDVLLRSGGDKRNFMSVEDRFTFDSLPEELELFHGTWGEKVTDFSWTTDFEVAKKFAYRLEPKTATPKIFRATVKKKDIFAYTNERSEKECIILKPVKNIEKILLLKK